MKLSLTRSSASVACGWLFSLVCVATVASPAWAAPAADTVFPDRTVAFFSVTDPVEFDAKWDRTQIGQFAADASLQPFVEQIRGELIAKFGNIEQRLGMTLDDVTAAAGGELGVGMLHTEGQRASVAVVLDTTGKQTEAAELIAKAEAELAKEGATRRTESYAGTEMTILELKATAKRDFARDMVHFRRGNLLCAVDSVDDAKRMIDSLADNAGKRGTLAGVKSYSETMSRCQAESRGLKPDVRWFADPFAWNAARESLTDKPILADRKDTITLLAEQGFDAIRGIGGHISLAVNEQEDIIHRTAVYAPPKPGTEGKSAKEKYNLGMRMAELPNRPNMPVQSWTPRMIATYATVNLDILNAFDHVESLFDAMSGYEGAFRHTLDSFEEDPYGPEIQVRKQLVKNLGKRITMMTDYKLPITTDCERYTIVVEVTNAELLRSPIDKLMENDGALKQEINGVPYWEIVPEDETLTRADLPDDLLLLDEEGGFEEEADTPERLVKRAAVCLKGNQLIVASDVEFLRQVLFGVEPRESLAESLDFKVAMQTLDKLADRERCSWAFYRTDESIRPSYELIRQGLMPQSQSFFGRFLNELLTTQEDEEQGIVRKQRIDGSQLPTFELARRYFGPAARSIRTDDDGWFITGVVLSKAGQ